MVDVFQKMAGPGHSSTAVIPREPIRPETNIESFQG